MSGIRAEICSTLITLMLSVSTFAQCEVAQLTDGVPGPTEDDFGRGVAMDGDVLVVGAGPGDAPGSVRVYRRNGFEWNEEAFLMAPVPVDVDVFGSRVDLKGDWLIVGSQNATPFGFASGAAYVYRFNRTRQTWDYNSTLIASDGASNDRFGISVAMDDDPPVIIVGARDKDSDEGIVQAGAAYVFRYDGKEWVEEQKLLDPRPRRLDLFGASCAIEDDLAVIGADGDSEAFVFRSFQNQWRLEAQLEPSNPDVAASFGDSVDVRSDRIIVGAKQSQNGYAFLYEFDAQSMQWQYQMTFVPTSPVGVSGSFGQTVSFGNASDLLVISAPNDSEAAHEAGALYLFHEDEQGWDEGVKLMAEEPTAGSCLGCGLAVSGDFAVGGAPCAFTGEIRVFAGITDVDCNANDAPDGCDIFFGTSSDEDGDGVPDECAPGPIGDLDADGDVDFADLLLLLDTWGPCERGRCIADLDGSGDIGFADLILLLSKWT